MMKKVYSTETIAVFQLGDKFMGTFANFQPLKTDVASFNSSSIEDALQFATECQTLLEDLLA